MNVPGALRLQRQIVLQIPQLWLVGLSVLALGILLDAVWPQQLWSLTVRWGLGPVLSLIGIVLAMAVVGPALLQREARRARTLADKASERAKLWEDRASAQ